MKNEKKAVIYTLNHINYGAVLQCCGLVNYLRGIGVDAESLNLNTPYHQKLFRVFAPYSDSRLRQMFYHFFCLLRYAPLKRKIRRFIRFRQEWLHLNLRAYESEEDVLKNPPSADVYVSGSDQVFQPEGKRRRIFYLNFPVGQKQKKIAYAASFGTDTIKPDTLDILKPWVEDFFQLSVREESGARLLEKMTGSRPPVVLDPVFLPDASFWQSLAGERLFPQKYIVVYELNGGNALIQKAKAIADRLHLPVYVITTKPHKFYPVEKQLYDCGPKEFLSLLRHAEYIVTDSFHGTCFALIFRIPFITMAAIRESSDRLVTLLKNAGMEKRLIFPETPIPPEDGASAETEGTARLTKLQDLSRAYLKDIFIKDKEYNERA